MLEDLVFGPLKMRSAALVDTVRPDVPGPAYSGTTQDGARAAVCGPERQRLPERWRLRACSARRVRERAAVAHFTRRADDDKFASENYALGGRVRTIGGRRWAWETGKVQGYRTVLAHDLERERTILILNNTDINQALLAAVTDRMIATMAWDEGTFRPSCREARQAGMPGPD